MSSALSWSWLLVAGWLVEICLPGAISAVYTAIPLGHSIMIPPRWALIDIVETSTATGVEVVVTTDIPCHLWMRWSIKPPWIHSKAVLTRGLRTRDDVRFCFTVFTDNEQEDAGDTLIHTFLKEPWSVCETRYYYFHGTIGGVVSPSTSGIFKFHKTAVPQTLTLYPESETPQTTVDGWTRAVGPYPSWSAMVAAPGFDASPSESRLIVRYRSYFPAGHWLYLARTFLLFDATPLPLGSTVVGAKLGVHCYRKFNSFAFKPAFAVYGSDPLSNTTLVTADHPRVFDTRLSSLIDFDDIAVGAYSEFIFLQPGLDLIIPGEILKFSLRTQSDAEIVSPTWQDSKNCYIYLRSTEYLEVLQPYLEITYLAP